MKITYIIFLLIVISTGFAFPQAYTISGKITDSRKNEALAYANIKVADSTYGTTANENGDYIIKLSKGNYHLEVSYIGYLTEDLYLDVESDLVKNVMLIPSAFVTEEIKVFGEDPAIGIVKKAIQYKKEFKSKLNEYNYDAFSKFVIRSNMTQPDSTVEKGKLPIFGILESETKGYFQKPDNEKEIVISKKETANISRGFALPFIVNFYDENIDLGELKIPGPLSDDAFDNYEFKYKGTTALDSLIIHKIQVINTSNIKPQFLGTIYIVDSIFALKKVELNTNEAGVIRGINELKFLQKFDLFKDKSKNIFWLPTDVEIFAKGEVFGLIKFEGEVFTIVSSYRLNEKAPAGIFDEVIVKVLPDAEKDSAYWKEKNLIKNSAEEQNAYSKIKEAQDKNKTGIHLGLNTVNYGQNFYTNFFEFYNFNRVQGHTLMYNLNYGKNFGRVNLRGNAGYGFADKNWLYEIDGKISLLKDKSLILKFSGYDKTKTLFKNQSWLSYAENVAFCWILKDDRYDYFYGNGFSFQASKNIIPQFGLSLGFSRETQKAGVVNSDFSLFSKSKSYRENAIITENTRSEFSAGIKLDPNKYKAIDWGDGTLSRFPVTEFPSINFSYSFSGEEIGSTYLNRKYSVSIFGENSFASFLNLKYKAGYIKYFGDVPFQDLGYFDVGSFASTQGLVFYTMGYLEFLGDKIWYINLENDFGKYLIGNIPVIKKLTFSGIVNLGKAEISRNNFDLSSYKKYSETDGIFVEAGFSVGRIFEILKTTFTWRLNNFNTGNNFNFQLILNGF